MATRKFYSQRVKKHWKYDAKLKKYWSWGYDIRLTSGRRVREAGFATEADAIVAVGKVRTAEKEKKYGFIPAAARPELSLLVEKRLATITNRREHTRSTRVLHLFLSLLPKKFKVDEITTAHVRLYVERRLADGLKPQSVNRELNIIAATLNAAESFYPQLAQWVPPRIPRPKKSHARRERVYTDEEKSAILDWLLAPRRKGEQENAARARRRVGLQFQFALLTGMRHGEMDHVRKEHIDWQARTLKVIGTKKEMVSNPTRYISPLTDTMVAILKEFCEKSKTDYVFTRSGNTIPNFYRIMREACTACSISYGRDTVGGLVFHDTRHTATTRMLQGNVDLATIQSFTGHSDKTMVLYYSHATPKSRELAARVLEGYAGSGPKRKRAELEPEVIEALSILVAEGRLEPTCLAAILRGEEEVPEHLFETLVASA